MRIVILILVVLASLVWIAFSGFELLNKDKNSYSPSLVFNSSDSSILIVNDAKSISDFNLFNSVSENKYLENSNLKNTSYKLFFSKYRNILLVENLYGWTDDNVESFLNTSKIAGSDVKGRGYNYLLCTDIAININDSASFLAHKFDENAVANLFQFKQTKTSDIYLNDNNLIQYQSKADGANLGKPVNDIALFSELIPREIENYQFYEHFYLQQEDSVYKNGILSQWVDKGLVIGGINGEKFIISDFKASQIPTLVLSEQYPDSLITNDKIKMFKGYNYISGFSEPEENVYILELSDKVVLSKSKRVCEKIILNRSVGKTINPKVFASDKLNTKVHKRTISKKQQKSITISNGLEFKTLVNGAVGLAVVPNAEIEIYTTEKPIQSYTVIKDHLREDISVFVSFTDKSYGLYAANGMQIWEGECDEQQIGDAKEIDIYRNGRTQIAFTTSSGLTVLDLNGKLVSGFPYSSDKQIITPVNYVVWKGQSRFVFGLESNAVVIVNQKGAELNIKKSGVSLSKSILDVFSNAGKLTCAVSDGSNYSLINLQNPSKPLLKASKEKLVKVGRVEYAIKKTQTSFLIRNLVSDKTKEIEAGKIEFTNKFLIAVEDQNIVVYNQNLKETFTVPYVTHTELLFDVLSVDKDCYLVVLDELTNNLYLYNKLGELQNGFPKEGKQQVSLRTNLDKSELQIFTTLENRIIRYTIKK